MSEGQGGPSLIVQLIEFSIAPFRHFVTPSPSASQPHTVGECELIDLVTKDCFNDNRLHLKTVSDRYDRLIASSRIRTFQYDNE